MGSLPSPREPTAAKKKGKQYNAIVLRRERYDAMTRAAIPGLIDLIYQPSPLFALLKALE